MPTNKSKKTSQFASEEMQTPTGLLPVVDIFNTMSASARGSQSSGSISYVTSTAMKSSSAKSSPTKLHQAKTQFQKNSLSGLHSLYRAFSDKKKHEKVRKEQKKRFNALVHIFSFKTIVFVALLILLWNFGPTIYDKVDHYLNRQTTTIDKTMGSGRKYIDRNSTPVNSRKIFRQHR